MSEWVIFGTEVAARTAVRQIDALLGNPRKGRDPVTGEPRLAAVGEETWAEPVQLLDGRWGFPRHPTTDPARPFDVEPWNRDWFPPDDD